MGVMIVSMLMFASFPHTEGKWGFGVALPMVAILFAWPIWLTRIGGRQMRFLRALLWAPVLSIPWIAGAMASGSAQVAWWGVGVALIYAIAWIGYPVPRLGHSEPDDWAITGTRLSTRCGQMIVIGFGESFLVASGRLALRPPPPAQLTAWMVAFLASFALWWIYNESSTEATRSPTQDDADSLWRSAYTYLHVPMILGIIAVAAADEVVIANPTLRTRMGWAVLILGAPALFLASDALFIEVICKRVPREHLIAVVALVAMAPLAVVSSTLVLMTVVTSVVVALALWETAANRRVNRLSGEVLERAPKIS
jgi:low temperature requirement protein LtrA